MSTLNRFLGGSPVAVALKLALVSFLVGWFLLWLDFTPGEVWTWVRDLAITAWQSLGGFTDTIIVGAMVVVPVFLLMRIMAVRGPRG